MNTTKKSALKEQFLTIRLTPELKETLTVLSKELGVTRTSIVRKAIISEIRFL